MIDKEVLAIVLVPLVAIGAMIMLALHYGPQEQSVGLVANPKDAPKELGLTLQISPTVAYTTDKITLIATTDKKVENVTFSAANSDCKEIITTISSIPYSTVWAADTNCGFGKYTISATAVHASGKYETKTQTIILKEKNIVSQQNSNYKVSTSADTYPPAGGTSAQQTFATLKTPPAQEQNEQFTIHLTVTGQKWSGGTFNMDYRVFDKTTSTVLATGSLLNPVQTTENTLQTTVTIPAVGEEHDIAFQFKSSQLFSAVMLHGYSIIIEN